MYHVSAQGVDERMINVNYYYYYSCQPLLGVNLSPEFVNLYYASQGL